MGLWELGCCDGWIFGVGGDALIEDTRDPLLAYLTFPPFQCHRIHRTLADQFKYALVWVSVCLKEQP